MVEQEFRNDTANDADVAARGYRRAVQAWNRLLLIDPLNTDALREICDLLEHLEQWAKAQQYYENWLELEPNNVTALSGLGRIHQRLDHPEEAQNALTRAWWLGKEKLAWIAVDLGNTLFDRELYEQAREAYLNATVVDEHNAVAWRNLGLAYEKLAQLDKALEAQQRAVDADPEDSEAHYCLACLLAGQNNTAEAEAHYRKAIDLNPGHADYWHGLGSLLWHADRLPEAEEVLRQTLTLQPDDAYTHVDLGITLSKAGRYDEGEAILRHAMELDPKDAVSVYNLAYLYEQSGRKDEAVRAYREAIRLAPEEPRSYENLANLLRDQGLYRDAEAVYQRALELVPEDGSLLGNLGWQCYLEGDYSRCIELTRKGMPSEPGTWWMPFNIALAQLASGDLKAAQETYKLTAAECRRPKDLDMALQDLRNLLRVRPELDPRRAIAARLRRRRRALIKEGPAQAGTAV
jgi:tetratricopeptide (TPR) repeat protein